MTKHRRADHPGWVRNTKLFRHLKPPIFSTADETTGSLECFETSAKCDRHGIFFWKIMAGHATVGIEALRCTGGAGETKNAAWD